MGINGRSQLPTNLHYILISNSSINFQKMYVNFQACMLKKDLQPGPPNPVSRRAMILKVQRIVDGGLIGNGDYWGLMEDLNYPLIPNNPY